MTTPQPAGLFSVRLLRIVAAASASIITLMTAAQPPRRPSCAHWSYTASARSIASLLAHRDYWARFAAKGKTELGVTMPRDYLVTIGVRV